MRTDVRAYVLGFALASLLGLPASGGAEKVPPKQAVRVDSISPTAAHRGDTVTVQGANFGGLNVRIAVAGVPAPLVSATGSVATFRVPAGAPFGQDTVRVTEPGGTSATIGLEVDYDGQATIVTDDAQAVVAEIGAAGG